VLLLGMLKGMWGCIGLTGPHNETDCICTRGVVVVWLVVLLLQGGTERL
jgi:hypothetical protein